MLEHTTPNFFYHNPKTLKIKRQYMYMNVLMKPKTVRMIWFVPTHSEKINNWEYRILQYTRGSGNLTFNRFKALIIVHTMTYIFLSLPLKRRYEFEPTLIINSISGTSRVSLLCSLMSSDISIIDTSWYK